MEAIKYRSTESLINISSNIINLLDGLTFGESVFVMTMTEQKIKEVSILCANRYPLQQVDQLHNQKEGLQQML